MKKIVLAFLLIAFLGFSISVSAMTDSEKQALINQIQQQIAILTQQLQEMLAEQSGTNVQNWCYTFNNNLGFNQSGTEPVAALHIALDKQNISYSPDAINIYATGTESAVKKFQGKYGISQTGYVGPVTREKLNSLYGCQGATDNQNTIDNTTINTNQACAESWTCASWSTCLNGQQTRTCTDRNNCGTNNLKPMVQQTCTASCSPDWKCGDWSVCTNQNHTRICLDLKNCGITTGKPIESESCTPPCTPNWECGEFAFCGDLYRQEFIKQCSGLKDGSIFTCVVNQPQFTTRTCVDKNNCGTTVGRPEIKQTCSHDAKTGCFTKMSIGPFGECQEINGKSIKRRECRNISSCVEDDIGRCWGFDESIMQQSCACEPQNWNCGAWSNCVGSQQTRDCTAVPATANTCIGDQANQLSKKETRDCYSVNAGGATATKRSACTASGGKYSSRFCFSAGAINYPNTCQSGVGICSAAPSVDAFNQIEVCECGAGKCFDGNSCVALPGGMTTENIPGSATVTHEFASYVPVITKFYPIGNGCFTSSGSSGYCSIDNVSSPNCLATSYSCQKPPLVIYSDPSTYLNFSVGWQASGANYCTIDGNNKEALSGIKYVTFREGSSAYYMLRCINEKTGLSVQKSINITFRQY